MSFHDCLRGLDPTGRRTFLANLGKTLLGVAACPSFLRLASAADPVAAGQPKLPRDRAHSVIYLFLRGGLSHLDSFDPKPGRKTQGPVQAIKTRADGVLVSQYWPKLAEQMEKVCVVNSMSSKQGAHPQAQYLMRTSYERRGTIQHPSLGAWHQRLCGKRNPTLPGHVIVGGQSDMPSAGFFPPEFQALPIGDPKAGLQNAGLPAGVDEARFQQRLARLQAMNEAFASSYRQREVAAYGETYAAAVRLMRSSDLAAFDIGQESANVRAAYGESPFGQGCLLARRLVEHGCRFVEVTSDGWDTHADNFDRLADNTPPVDQALACLLADLHVRGLLDDTLVVLATEFGRTPDIDQDQGRNHYPKAFSCLLAGGGVQGGRSFGRTDADGREVEEDPVSIQDFNATIAYCLGLPLDQELTSPSGRPFQVADKGEPITAILA